MMNRGGEPADGTPSSSASPKHRARRTAFLSAAWFRESAIDFENREGSCGDAEGAESTIAAIFTAPRNCVS
jgi:hypothetical protein